MAESKVITPASSRLKTTDSKKQPPRVPLFHRENYMWMGIGAAVVIVGMLLMTGGKNSNSNQFDYNVVYSTTRITIAPILILAGLMIEVYAIFKRPKVRQ
jgi:hypothetical protein